MAAVHQLDGLCRLVDDTLGGQVLGVYPYGSLGRSRLMPASDLDVLVVLDRPLTSLQRQRLVAGLLCSYDGSPGRRPVELTVVVQSRLRPWRYPPVADLVYGEWLRSQIDADGPPQGTITPNLAIELTEAMASGRSLTGPPLRELLDPVPADDLVRAGIDGLPSLLADLAADTRNVVLTIARIWLTIATGRVEPKDVAAGWAAARLPAERRTVLEHAAHLYRTCTYADEEPWPSELQAEVGPCVDVMLRELRTARPTGWSSPDGPWPAG